MILKYNENELENYTEYPEQVEPPKNFFGYINLNDNVLIDERYARHILGNDIIAITNIPTNDTYTTKKKLSILKYIIDDRHLDNPEIKYPEMVNDLKKKYNNNWKKYYYEGEGSLLLRDSWNDFEKKYVDVSIESLNLLKQIKELSISGDIFIQLLNYYKIDVENKKIITSDIKIYETFYNFLIMDYEINRIPKFCVNAEKKELIELNANNISIEKNKEYKKKIKLLKKTVSQQNRHKYLIQ